MATRRQVGQQKKAFLDAFARTGIVLAACRASDTNRASVYRWLEHDEEFALSYHRAEAESTEAMEAEALRRAVDGVEEPVTAAGRGIVGYVRKYSDTLLIFMLKARAPEKYRDRYDVRHSGNAEEPLKVRVEYAEEAEDAGAGYPTS